MIFLVSILIIVVIIALFARYIDPDPVLCYSIFRAPLDQVAGGGTRYPNYTVKQDAVILQDWIFRVGNINNPSVKGETFIDVHNMLCIRNGSGRIFNLGKVVFNPADTSSYSVFIHPDNQAVFRVSRSIIPYFYGWKIMSNGPLFRYFRYYSLNIRRMSGASLRAKWKFSTYRLPDGTWVGDYLGLHGEGLLHLDIDEKK